MEMVMMNMAAAPLVNGRAGPRVGYGLRKGRLAGVQVDFIRALEKTLMPRNIQVTKITPPFEGIEHFDYGLRKALDPQFDWPAFGRMMLEQVPPQTVVFAQGVFELHFALFTMPDDPELLICVGPWMDGPQSEQSRKWCEENLDDEAINTIHEYYNAVRAVDSPELKSTLFSLVSLLYPEGELRSLEWLEFLPLNYRPDLRGMDTPAFKKVLPAELIAERYAAENRTLDAVLRGDIDAAMTSVQSFGRFSLEPRFQNPMRELKNMAVIFNTLLRKTIERANVHPYYVDQISHKYALLIEALTNTDEEYRLRNNMVREYCMYVQQYSLQQYSPLIQKVINHINLHMDTSLSLKSLAAMCYISPSYLSNVFRQETGQTLTDYISTQRMNRAARLLLTTNETVASVAEEVGILDVNYFTKLFKNATGLTPTRYRREKRDALATPPPERINRPAVQ